MSNLSEQLHPQVFRIPDVFENGIVNLYLLVGEQLALVDTGINASVERSVGPALRELGLELARLDFAIATHAHPDHIGGNEAIRRFAANAKIMVHTADVPLTHGPEAFIANRYDLGDILRLIGREDMVMERHAFLRRVVGRDAGVDRWLQDGDTIDLGRGITLQVLHTPGHTPGAVCLYWEQEGMLFSGDTVQGRGGIPGSMPLYTDADDYLRSIRRLAELPLQTLCLGHAYLSGVGYSPAVRKGRAATRTLKESVAVAELIDAAVEAEVAAGGGPAPLVEFARNVLLQLAYDLPVMFDRDIGVPLHSLASIDAHRRLRI